MANLEKGLSGTSVFTMVLGATAVAAGFVALPATAGAATFVPPSVAPGTTYRLMFNSADTSLGTSSDIATYNAFVNSEASSNTGLPTTTWSAVVSTEAVSAATNVACAGDCANAPIYDVLGNEIAPSLAALFGGSPSALQYDQNGDAVGLGYDYSWTGSTSAGLIASGHALGDASPEAGSPYFGGSGFLDVGQSEPNDAPYHIMALSAGIVAAGVPEPSTWALMGLGAAALGLAHRRRAARLARA